MAKSLSLGSYGGNSLFATDAEKKKREAESAVNDFRFMEYSNEADFQNARNSYLNRDEFKYDVNDDAMYKAYKDMYDRQGNLAMKDTVGQIAAMSGGYGNSYAQTAGQQIYQAYMDTLNDRVPELYNMALNKYQLEGDRLAQNYALLQSEREAEYNKQLDAYNVLVANRDYYANRADTERNYNYQLERDKIADERYNTEWDYGVSRDKIADERYNTEWDYNTGQDAIKNALAQQSMNETIRMNDYAIEDGNRTYALNAAKMYSSGSDDSDKYMTASQFKKALPSMRDYFDSIGQTGFFLQNKSGAAKQYTDYVANQIYWGVQNGDIDTGTAVNLFSEYGVDSEYLKKQFGITLE